MRPRAPVHSSTLGSLIVAEIGRRISTPNAAGSPASAPGTRFTERIALPSGARVVDAGGQYVMPGGIDMHCHIAGPKVNVARKMRPEEKRKAIGNAFIEVFDQEAHKIEGVELLGQGTIYPDVIESVSYTGGPSVTIKSHHNVGGLPERMKMALVEPLRELFKDEVRKLGRELGMPDSMVGRHPFPGPGLAIRIPGELSAEKIDILRRADAVYIDEIRKSGLYDEIWQAFAALLPVRTVGVMGDARTYDYVCALRAVTSTDGMTADYYPFSHEFLGRVSNRIINEVRGINRVVYDVTSKPPGTIEWE